MGKHRSSDLVDGGVANLCSPESQQETNNGGISKRNVNRHWIPLAKAQASLAAGELVMSQIAAVINLYID